MKIDTIKRTALLASAAAFTLISGIAIAPHASLAKDPKAGATEMKNSTTTNSGSSLVEQLKLTDAQKKSIQGYRADRTRKINEVLTKDQKAKFEQAKNSGKSLSESLKAAGLKPDQQKKILEIAKNSAEKIKGTLTPTQKKQLEAYMKQRKGGVE